MFVGLAQYANPYFIKRLITRVSNEAPANVAPILPIEGSVISGRSAWGFLRSGFLEFQERIFEETVVAAVWLYGVIATNSVLNWFLKKQQKAGKLPHMPLDADWSKGFLTNFLPGAGKRASIHLSPMEAFNKSFPTMLKTLKFKGFKFGISVAVPLILTGLVIPRLNQLKTEWILKTFYNLNDEDTKHQLQHLKHERHTEDGTAVEEDIPDLGKLYESVQNYWNPSAQRNPAHWGQQMYSFPVAFQGQRGPGGGVPPFSLGGISSAGGGNLAQHPQHWSQPHPTARFGKTSVSPEFSPEKGNGPRFGSLASSVSNSLFRTGVFAHMVENSHYGSVLTTDVGVTGGRMVVAWPRSPYESFEYGFRDVASLFFYLMSVPLVMTLGAKLFNKTQGVVVKLDQQVTEGVNNAVMGTYDRLAKSLGVTQATPEMFGRLLHGTTDPAVLKMIPEAKKQLLSALREAPREDFMKLLNQELMAYAKTPQQVETAKNLFGRVESFLAGRTDIGSRLQTEHLEDMLNLIWNNKGKFKGLGAAERFNLNTAAKLAFHHNMGLSGQQMVDILKPLAGEIPEKELALLWDRVGHGAALGGDRTLASVLRRSLNVASLTGRGGEKLVEELDPLVRVVEKAVLEGVPLNKFAESRLTDVLDELARANISQWKNRNPAQIRQLKTLAKELREALKSPDAVLDAGKLKRFAKLLTGAGRRGPMPWLQGPGLKHLASEVEHVIPLVDGKTPLSQLSASRIEKLMGDLIEATANSPRQVEVLKRYQGQVRSLLAGEGRVSLLVSRSSKDFKEVSRNFLNLVLKGGLKHDDQVLKNGLRALGRMPESAEAFFNPEEFSHIRHEIHPYLDNLAKKVTKPLSRLNLQKTLQGMSKRNTMWRMGVWGAALAVSMFGVGFLVPKAQYWLTRTLTGKDEAPGIAAMAKKLGADKVPA